MPGDFESLCSSNSFANGKNEAYYKSIGIFMMRINAGTYKEIFITFPAVEYPYFESDNKATPNPCSDRSTHLWPHTLKEDKNVI